MTALTHDTLRGRVVGPAHRIRTGLLLACLSAASFGMSGALATPLLDQGWSPGAVVLIRVAIGALLLTPFGLRALRGYGATIRRNLLVIGLFGLLAVAGAQFCYYSAVRYMAVGPAILIEFSAPAAVVLWMWLRHGHRPGPLMLVGAAVAAVGLMCVLDIFTAGSLSTTGVLWALGAMLGNAAYFIINGNEEDALPPIGLAWLGMLAGGALLAALGGLGLLPMQVTAGSVELAGTTTPWWLPLALLGVMSAAVSYGTGVGAARLLGSRLASFVGLLEVVMSVVFAWLLLGEVPGEMQALGGALILAGVVAVKLGEERLEAPVHVG